MQSKIFIENIWAEDLFKWLYEHVMDSGGDGAGAIVCKNYHDACRWFTEQYPNVLKRIHSGTYKVDIDFHEEVSFGPGWAMPPAPKSDIIIHDSNENFIFTYDENVQIYHMDYIFIVKKDCPFSMGRGGVGTDRKIIAL